MKENGKEKKIKLLEALIRELQESEEIQDMSLFTEEELDAPVDVARAMIVEMGTELVDVLGEFFFLPLENEEVLYFVSSITVMEEIPLDKQMDLAIAVARLNSLIPCGAFAMGNGGENLIYRYTVPVSAELDEEVKMTMLLTAVDTAIQEVDRFIAFLMLVAAGELSVDDMMSLLSKEG